MHYDNVLVENGYLQDDFTVAPVWKGKFFMLFLGDYVDRGAYGGRLWRLWRLWPLWLDAPPPLCVQAWRRCSHCWS